MIPELHLSHVDPDGSYPDIRDYHERVGRALVQVLALSHRIVLTGWPDGSRIDALDDLRRVRDAVANSQDDAAPLLAQVGPQEGNVWGFFRYLIAPESERVVKPAGLTDADPGRWVQQVLPIGADCGTRRYLAHVEYVSDQIPVSELINRCRNKTPALFVSLQGDELEEHDQGMAYHKVTATYRLRVISANYHGGVQARFESPTDIDRLSDPGTHRALGDCRRALIHDNTLQRCLGVEKVALGALRPLDQRDTERMLCDSIQVKIIGYVYSPNAPCEIVAPWKMWLQMQDELGKDAGPPFEIAQNAVAE